MHALSIHALNKHFDDGSLTSEALVTTLLKRIQTIEPRLNSLADINHQALLEARRLDVERKTQGKRSLLHGIPIVVKDNIFTKDGLRTTANSRVFRHFYAPYDATLITHLKAAGAIILAKANCSEFAYFMSMGRMPSGYGSLNKQVKHPYNPVIDPLGSSTGSAVAVAAELAVASVGTETNGSLMSPAKQNSVVSLKPTLGQISRHGIIPITLRQDTAGPMAKTVEDAAILFQVMQGVDVKDMATTDINHKPYDLNTLYQPLKGLKIGVLRWKNHALSDEEQTILNAAETILKAQGVHIKAVQLTYDLVDNRLTMHPEFKRDFNHFLSQLGSNAPVTSLSALIKENQKTPALNLVYGQTDLIKAQGKDIRLKDPAYLAALLLQEKQLLPYLALFDDVDLLITTQITGYPAIAGLPSVIVPAKPLTDLTPHSVLFIGPRWSDDLILNCAYHYELATKHRIAPTF